ncbi:magnesium transporter [Candidatus Saccharibacteria bacterium]|nr:magnesium transporter [Candidatus Saccharibacteria bacterium]
MRLPIIDQKIIDEIKLARGNKIAVFYQTDDSLKGFVLLALPKQTRKQIISLLDNSELAKILSTLDPDKATDILQELPKHRAKHLTESLDGDVKEKVELLLSFNPKTAAGLMNLDYIVAPPGTHFEDLSADIEEHEKRTGKFPSIFVIDNGKLVGELPGSVLAMHKGKEKIDAHIKRVPHIRYDNDEHTVIDSFLKHPHDKVVVLDENEDIIGVIHSDDLLALLNKKRSSDLYGLAGVNREEASNDSILSKVKFRWVWLIINLGTAFLAASVVGMFEGTISRLTLLAVYMPIVAGMGGNAATQTLAVTVRGIVMQEVSLKNSVQYILKEVAAGVINGLINGFLVALVAIFINKNPMLGLVLAIAMVCNLFIAAFAGALIPLIMKKLGKDPATSATIFITTCTDVGGFFVFLGLAQIML